jgi:spore coat polysaccharide biosynthesis predicted glycosyltransferase SpsG
MWRHERQKLEKILHQYTDGNFDGMTDSYVYKEGSAKKPMTCKYAFLRNEFSKDVKAIISENLKINWGVSDDKECMAKRGIWMDQAIYQDLSALDDMPESRKEVKR